MAAGAEEPPQAARDRIIASARSIANSFFILCSPFKLLDNRLSHSFVQLRLFYTVSYKPVNSILLRAFIFRVYSQILPSQNSNFG